MLSDIIHYMCLYVGVSVSQCLILTAVLGSLKFWAVSVHFSSNVIYVFLMQTFLSPPMPFIIDTDTDLSSPIQDTLRSTVFLLRMLVIMQVIPLKSCFDLVIRIRLGECET